MNKDPENIIFSLRTLVTNLRYSEKEDGAEFKHPALVAVQNHLRKVKYELYMKQYPPMGMTFQSMKKEGLRTLVTNLWLVPRVPRVQCLEHTLGRYSEKEDGAEIKHPALIGVQNHLRKVKYELYMKQYTPMGMTMTIQSIERKGGESEDDREVPKGTVDTNRLGRTCPGALHSRKRSTELKLSHQSIWTLNAQRSPVIWERHQR
ncbi:hypothetical protein DFH07DRAFT_768499 [Mycena maculata]|uniref:Uncharacterized protein n=1 Tax=Mycena maculata TaxID=230809 RepID=A0AAD7JWY2_9AGAR|nr:hypothetical protein DFH07DRAFT_768499 [Mycena maculata]